MEEVKYCSKCDKDKPVSEFYKNKTKKGGLSSNCKECDREYRETPAGKQTVHRWNASAKCKAAKFRHQRSEKGQAAQARRNASAKTKQAKCDFQRRKREQEDPEEARRIYQAHMAVAKALRRGELIRPGECEKEDETCLGRIESHHEDYNKQLDVNWLCQSHHRRRHVELKTLNSVEVEDD